MPKILKTYLKNTQGTIAVWAAVMTPVLLGAAALSVDAARIYNLDHELQSAADALARAGAAELDQGADSITRANRAITNLVENTQKFSRDGVGQVVVNNIRYLRTVPSDDSAPIAGDLVTADPTEARFVEVSVSPETLNVMFPSLFKGRTTSASEVGNSITSKNTSMTSAENNTSTKIRTTTLDATSVAVRTGGICGAAPIFVCNPFEGTNTNIYLAMGDRNFRRRLIRLKSPKAKHGPGNFGFLDVGNGASGLREAIAVDIPRICLQTDTGVTTKPGNVASVDQALNTRFDLYEGSFKGQKGNPAYRPALNVTKGYSYSGKACNSLPNPLAMGLPKDSCFITNTCPHLNGNMGDGVWDFVSYVAINHNLASQLFINGTTYKFNYLTHTVTPADIPTRYEVYRWEIDTDSIPGSLTYGNALTPEEGKPQCYTGGSSTTDKIDRRLLRTAILNCNAIEQAGGFKGKSGPHPVEAFVNVFVTLPMGKSKDNEIYGEIVGPVAGGDNTIEKVAVVR